jgi:anaerobic magnesium-protoporphyrin IX monomethyl ester cyclase
VRILLVNPPNIHIVGGKTSTFIDSFVKDNAMPPLGLMYLAAYIERCTEHEVKICDLHVSGWGCLLSDLYQYTPDVVGITTTTMTLYDALDVAKVVKRFSKDIVTVMGGAHCSIYPQETASFPEVDYVVQGEGELPFLRVLRGIAGKVAEPEIIEDLDSLPMPARHLVDLNKYHSVLNKKKTTSILTSRNCNYACSFCYQPHWGKKMRARSASNVVQEMGECVKMGIGEIEIMDDTFTYDRQRIMEICDQLIFYKANRYWSVDFNIRTRVDKVDLEMLKKLKLAGCKRINYGVESYVHETLKTLRKGFDVKDIDKALYWTKEVGIEVQAYLMIGSPDESKRQMIETIDCVNKVNPDFAYYSITTPMPGTSMYQQGLKEGRYTDYWREFALNPTPDFQMPIWNESTRDEMIRIMEQAYRSFYFRPSYILRQIGRVKSVNELINKGRMTIAMVK